MDLICGELVRLGTNWNFHDSHRQLGGEAGGDYGTSAAPSLIAIKHQGDLSEVLLKEHLLPVRKGAPH